VQHGKRDLITAVSILAAALAIIFYVIPNFIDMEEEFELASLSPAFFPGLASWVIAALAGVLVISALLQKNKSVTDEGNQEWLSRAEELNAYKSALVIVGYAFAMKYIGFLIATALVLSVLLVFQDIKKPLHVALISILVTGGVFLFFYFIMQVHLPKGLIFE
jgi:hypothetical protein